MSTPRRNEWFDDDAFWQDFSPLLFSDTRFAEAHEHVEKVLTLTNPPGTAALDLCCGPGRFAIALAQRGFSVTGVDRTAFLLDKAKERAQVAQVTIEWVQQDMRDFVQPDSFDLVLSMFTSFGYFDSPQDDILVLRNMLTSLRPGGKCLIDVMGKERLARTFQATTSELLPDGTTVVQRHEIVDDWTRVRNEWILLRMGRAKHYTFGLTVYSGRELRDRMQQVGFVDVRLYGNLDGDAYGLNAQRLITVGRKPDA